MFKQGDLFLFPGDHLTTLRRSPFSAVRPLRAAFPHFCKRGAVLLFEFSLFWVTRCLFCVFVCAPLFLVSLQGQSSVWRRYLQHFPAVEERSGVLTSLAERCGVYEGQVKQVLRLTRDTVQFEGAIQPSVSTSCLPFTQGSGLISQPLSSLMLLDRH